MGEFLLSQLPLALQLGEFCSFGKDLILPLLHRRHAVESDGEGGFGSGCP